MRFESIYRLDSVIGGPVCRILAWLRGGPQAREPGSLPSHVLLVKLRGIGDIILALPMIGALKKNGARITFVTGPANRDWLAGQPLIDELLVIDFQRLRRSLRLPALFRRIRALGARASIDLTQSANFPAILSLVSRAPVRIGFENRNPGKRSRNRLCTHLVPFTGREHMAVCFFDLLRPFGIRRVVPLRLVPPSFSQEDAAAVSLFLEQLDGPAQGKLVGIHVSGDIVAKRWPLANWAEVCGNLMSRGYTVIAVGAACERETVARLAAGLDGCRSNLINAAGRLTLNQVFALMPRLRFFIANDGGPMHIAAASGLPTLGLFGPEVPRRYAPLNDDSRALYAGGPLACSPCSRPYEGSWPTCRRPECMDAITPAAVLEAVGELEQRSSP